MIDLGNIEPKVEMMADIISRQLDTHQSGDEIDWIEMLEFSNEYKNKFTLEELTDDNLKHFWDWLDS